MKQYQFSENEYKLLENMRMPLGIYQYIDGKVVTLILSDGFLELFGYKPDEREEAKKDMEGGVYAYAHPDDRDRVLKSALAFAIEDVPYEVIYRQKAKGENRYKMIHAVAEHIYMGNTRLAYMWFTCEGYYNEAGKSSADFRRGFGLNINKALHEESFLHNDYYDVLTGLPNVAYFFNLAEIEKSRCKESGKEFVMLFMDLRGMKYYNQKYGFVDGDKLLVAFANLLVEYFGKEQVSRFSGDHFLVATEKDNVEAKLLSLFADTSKLNSGVSLPVQVGIYTNNIDDLDVSVACDMAKLACEELKDSYNSDFAYFTEELKRKLETKQYIIDNIDNAIKNGWIEVYYQAIVRAVNGSVCDEEALARWIDPERGFMSPGEFIPILEDAKLLYKLDLHVLDEVIKKIKDLTNRGLYVVPQSINLSRTDFDCCDMVNEIKNRVDAAGIPHDKITIEITESVIGKNFEFMKKQVERFSELGFPVWMDDFGSGYSSLDVLQSIRVNLIKFDMKFLQNLENNDDAKIILTSLMKMANSLKVDTICEGVETSEQVKFLREIGCSKLQGFYYAKPISFKDIMNRFENQKGLMTFDNPSEASYYETVGKVNLHDLDIMSSYKNNELLFNVFTGLPMGILELDGEKVKVIRSNQSGRDFLKKQFRMDISDNPNIKEQEIFAGNDGFLEIMKQCAYGESQGFIDTKTVDDLDIHYFVKRIAHNPANNSTAIAIVALSVSKTDDGATYAEIARALAADYFNLFYVNIDTDDFVEYTSKEGLTTMVVERRGKDFFAQSRKDAKKVLYKEDQDEFISAFTKENVLSNINRNGNFKTTYRMVDKDGHPIYAAMKCARMGENSRFLIIAVSNVDAQMKREEMVNKIKQEKIFYNRMSALAGEFICLYTVDIKTNHYLEYSSIDEFKEFGIAEEGADFFKDAARNGEGLIHKDDEEKYKVNFTKERMLEDIKEKGGFELKYRLLIGNIMTNIVMKAAITVEDGEEKLIIGLKREIDLHQNQ